MGTVSYEVWFDYCKLCTYQNDSMVVTRVKGPNFENSKRWEDVEEENINKSRV